MDIAILKAAQQENVCGKCGGGLLMPQGKSLQCRNDKTHTTIKPKNRNTRFLANNVEVDILSQQEMNTALAIPTTHEDASAIVTKAWGMGMIGCDDRDMRANPLPERMIEALAHYCLRYQLDPQAGELAILFRKPYPTIKARRRKDYDAGHRPSFDYIFMTADELASAKDMGMLKDGDMALWCSMEAGNQKVRRLATITKYEQDRMKDQRVPIVGKPIEMLEKRGEAACREAAFGGMGVPDRPVEAINIGEDNTIEGKSRVVNEETGELPQDDDPTGEQILDAAVGPSASDIAPPIDPPKPPSPQPRTTRKAPGQPPLVEEPDTGDMFPVEH